jgi:ribonuclease E
MAIEVVRMLILASHHPDASKINITVADEVATFLNNRKRRELSKLEDETKVTVQVLGAKGVSPEHLAIECHDAQGRELRISFG